MQAQAYSAVFTYDVSDGAESLSKSRDSNRMTVISTKAETGNAHSLRLSCPCRCKYRIPILMSIEQGAKNSRFTRTAWVRSSSSRRWKRYWIKNCIVSNRVPVIIIKRERSSTFPLTPLRGTLTANDSVSRPVISIPPNCISPVVIEVYCWFECKDIKNR